MDDSTLANLFFPSLGRTGLTPAVGQFVCISGTLRPSFRIQVITRPRVLDVALTGTGFGSVLLGATSSQVRRTLRTLVGHAVTLCGTVRLGRGAAGVPILILDVAFVLPAGFGTPLVDRSVLRRLFALLLLGGLDTNFGGVLPLGGSLGGPLGLSALVDVDGLLTAGRLSAAVPSNFGDVITD